MVLNFTVEYLNICNEWHHICHGHHKGEKAHGSKRQKPDVHIGFWRLCTASVHVNTAFIFLSTLNLPPCLSKIFKYMMFKFLKMQLWVQNNNKKKNLNIFTQALQQNPLPDSYHHHRKERNYSVLARQHFLKTCPLWGSFSSNISKNEFSAKIRLCYLLDHTIMKLHERITKK